MDGAARRHSFWLRGCCLGGLAFGVLSAYGQTTTPPPPPETLPVELPRIEVIGTTPLPGIGIDRDQVPANVQSFTTSDLRREGSASILNGLQDQAASINANDNAVDAFQPDIVYRGFEASPVLGTPEGLAVYQNGVRVNEAFGDNTNWDLIPDVAIRRVDIISANPVYGLNALGGAVVVTMKDGFSYHGLEGEAAGGSFGQRNFSFQYGTQISNYSAYVAGKIFDDDGWRKFSPDHVQQLYADFGRRWERGSIHIDFTGASNRLYGQGTTPEQELGVDRTLVFTVPQSNLNKLTFVTLKGSYLLTDALSVDANLYRRAFNQTVVNGNTTDYTACASANGDLCQSDGTTLVTQANGAPIPDLSQGGAVPIGEDDGEKILTISTGGTLQATYTGAMLGRANNAVVGGSLDRSNTSFESDAGIGVINPALQVLPSGFFADEPEDTDFTATPVKLHATTRNSGFFVTDTFNVTPQLALTTSGRYNHLQVDLADHRGTDLSGGNKFARFNPAFGGTFKVDPRMTVYAGYAENNRAPTAGEIECSNPEQPCLLPSSLSSDPPNLRQVVSRTVEVGLRGKLPPSPTLPGTMQWNLGVFRARLADDIYGIATSVSSGFFQNIGATRRQGLEASLKYRTERWSAYATYSWVMATFESPLTLASENNPFADANGNIHVVPGDRLPGIPQHQVKAGVDYHIVPKVVVGVVLSYYSSQFLRGDEANLAPTLPGHAVVNLHGSYAPNKLLELFANVQNVFDARYASFGAYGDPTGIGAPGIPAGAMTNGPGVDNRFVAPSAPVAVFGGLRIKL